MSAAYASEEARRLLTFEIGEGLFALPIAAVLEVAERGPVACMPTVPPGVAGVLNYRGDALPVVRREHLLEVEAGREAAEHVLVISDRPSNAPRLGLEVDRVLGLVDGEGAESPRGGGPVAERRPLEGRLANVVDPGRLVARAREVIEGSLARGG